jgi:hypothetical protein
MCRLMYPLILGLLVDSEIVLSTRHGKTRVFINEILSTETVYQQDLSTEKVLQVTSATVLLMYWYVNSQLHEYRQTTCVCLFHHYRQTGWLTDLLTRVSRKQYLLERVSRKQNWKKKLKTHFFTLYPSPRPSTPYVLV